MRNVKRNITNKINAFRWYKYRPRIDSYFSQNIITNITDPFIGVSAIARISIHNQIDNNLNRNYEEYQNKYWR